MANKIEKVWESFEESVVPKHAGEVQRREMKIAFFGGAQAMRLLLIEELASLEEKDAAMFLYDIDNEIKNFAHNQTRKHYDG